ncbi:MAG: SDR family NAD(P)-dependent oxidoreductase [Bacteroidota bacterium]|nr:SDR family NAD(P)-dependent oxidoreductase [Bacteroidota bacterium]MEE3147110.1 SDR family NAD(P)-dependent oxidoreductase [Bacteroidota bacterium]
MKISELKNQTILITGAAGSIGRELVLGLAQYQPKQLILVDISELGMHSLLQEMAIHFPQVKLTYYLESICDAAFIAALFERQRIDLVFHAAAYKHVSLMEANVCAAIKTNIKGAKLLIDTSCKHKISRFIFISTDKAVEPVSIMGMTKKVVEEYLLFKQSQAMNTQLNILRLCNVYDSSGSVVPVFKERIQQKLSLEIKGDEVQRAYIQKDQLLPMVLAILDTAHSGRVFIPKLFSVQTVAQIANHLVQELLGISLSEYPIAYKALPEYEKEKELLYLKSDTVHSMDNDVLLRIDPSTTQIDIEMLMQCIKAAEAFKSAEARVLLQKLAIA